VKRREEAFQMGKIKKVLNSVLKRSRGGEGLKTVERQDGEHVEEPEEVAREVNKHFENTLRVWGCGRGLRRRVWGRE